MSEGQDEPWSYSTKRAGKYRVRVYEREVGSPLSISWRDQAGRHRKSLSAVFGGPVRDREHAREVAERVADSLEGGKTSGLSLRERAGFPAPRSIYELYEALFEDRADIWSSEERARRTETRNFWFQYFGPGRPLHTISVFDARTAVKEAAAAQDWSREVQRTYKECLLEAFEFGYNEKKWLHWTDLLHELALVRDSGWDPRAEIDILLEQVEAQLLRDYGEVG